MKAALPVKELALEMLTAGGIGVAVWRLEDERDDSSLILEQVHPGKGDGSVTKSIGKRIDEAMPYVRSTGAPSIMARVASAGTPERLGSVWYIDTDFARAWYALAAFPGAERRVLVLFESVLTSQRAGQSLTFPSQLLQVVEQAIVATDADAKIIFWNRFAARLFGWTAPEVIDKPIASVAFASGYEAAGEKALYGVSAGHSWTGELLLKRNDASEFPAFVAFAPIAGPSDRGCGAVGVFYDITEQKNSRAAPRFGPEPQHALLDVIQDRVFRIDGQMRYLDYFGPSDQLVTSSSEGLIGRTVREVLAEELAERVEGAIRSARTERRSVRLDYELRIRGELRALEATFAPGVGDEVVVVSRDVTDRKREREELHRVLDDLERRVADRTTELQQVNTSLIALLEHRRAAEVALRDSFARLQSLVDGAPAAIIELDRNGHVVSWSRSAERMFGWTAEEAIGQYNPTVPPEQMGASLGLLAALTNGSNVDSFPLMRQTRAGQLVQVTMSTSAIRRGDGKIERFVVVYNRVEESVSADVEELTRRMRELSSLSRSITRSLDLDDAMHTLERELARLFDIRSGVLLLGSEGHLEVRFSWGSELTTARAMATSDDEEIRLVIDAATGREWLRAPLFDAGDEAGVLLLEAPSAQFDGDLSLLRDVAREVTAAVTNARLFDVARRGNVRLQELSRRLVEVQENERRHLGRELHDQIGQILTGLKLSLGAARDGDAGHSLADAEDLVADLLSRVRTLSLELRPPMLDDAGLIPALAWHVSRYFERTGVVVDFRHGEVGRLDAEIEIAAFRIVQEAMTNAARHGDARHLSLRVWPAAERLLVQIEDDGVGFSSGGAPRAQTAGLTGMKERAHLVGGTISIESTPGAGTRVAVDLPLSCRPRDSNADRHHR
jgi:PAS domain S-box-containing protein